MLREKYINALIKLDRLEDAKTVLSEAKNKGFSRQKLDVLDARIKELIKTSSISHSEKKPQHKISDNLKLDQAIKLAKNKAKNGFYQESEKVYKEI